MAEYPFRSALVTGASSGIGEIMAGRLADAGVATTVVARRSERLDALADRHTGVEPLVADLATEAGQSVVAARIANGDVDLVVNNAGFGTNGDFHTLDPDRLADEIEVNVAALTRLSHAALAVMVPRGSGWLLNVSSVAGFQPAPQLAVYAATKAYVTSLTESLHEEAAPHGVHVTALCPGLTKTEFQRVSNADRYADQFPSFVWTSPDEVARCGLECVVANRTLAVPGTQYKLMVAATNITPRWLRRRASAIVQRG
ncbi:MAG: short-chain dehydrogenase [Acidimicrobiaceae bacterium]|nr:short-chain dehydrogenase [Acidimicrobiaceae bacterium]